MKSLITAASFLFVLTGVSCNTTGSIVGTSANPAGVPRDAIVNHDNTMLSIADYLRRFPGVTINERSGAVSIRGTPSLTGGGGPIYVVNDLIYSARSYREIDNLIDFREIYYVRVLRGNSAARYGARGGNGAVVIVTK